MADVLAQLRSPRWIAMTVFALVVVVAFGMLSHWQWDRAHSDQDAAAAAADPPPVPVASITGTAPLAPGSYGRQVQVTGEYDAGAQRLVARGDSYWVLTPIQPADGPAVAVARGVVDVPQAPAPPQGTVTVVGRIEAYDGDPGPQPGDASVPAGQVPRLTASVLEPLVSGPVAGGWVALTAQTPSSTLPVVEAPSSPEAGEGIRWQNASYAVQWVLFAGCIAFFWWRWFRDELRETRAERLPAPVAP